MSRCRFRYGSLAVMLAAIAVSVWAFGSLAAKPTPPITLQFHETPVWLGPHEHWVTSLAFSPDGRTLASGCADGHLRFWDVATGRLHSVRGDDATRGIHGVAYSPDGKRVAAVGGMLDDEVVLFDATPEAIVRQLEPHSHGFAYPTPFPDTAPFRYKGKPVDYRVYSAVAFSPDGRLLATAPGQLVLHDAATGDERIKLSPPLKKVAAVDFSRDGKFLAAAEDKRVRLVNPIDGQIIATCDGSPQPIVSVAISPDGQHIAATASGKRSLLDSTIVSHVCYWDRQQSTALHKIDLGNVRAGQIKFVDDSTLLVAAGRELLEFKLSGAEKPSRRVIATMSEDITAVALSPDAKLLAIGGHDRTADVIERATGRRVHRLNGLTDWFSSVAASHDGQLFATATIDRRLADPQLLPTMRFTDIYDKFFGDEANAGRMQPGEVRLWSSATGRMQGVLPLPNCQVTAVDFIGRSHQLAIAQWTPQLGSAISLWDTDSQRHLRDLSPQKAEILSIDVAPDGTHVASGDAEGNITLWNLQTGAAQQIASDKHAIDAVAFSADGKWLAAASADRTVRLYDAAAGKVARTLTSRSRIKSLAFSPDGHQLAAGTRDPGFELWNLRTDSPSQTLKAPGDAFDSMPGFVAFSPDGRFVVCGGRGKDIAVFNAADGTLHCQMPGHAHPATAVAFLKDGRLASGGDDRTVRLWDPQQNKLLATWITMPADAAQQWIDQWIGYTPTGEFTGPENLNRLVGWQTGGEILTQPTAAGHQRVDNILQGQQRQKEH